MNRFSNWERGSLEPPEAVWVRRPVASRTHGIVTAGGSIDGRAAAVTSPSRKPTFGIADLVIRESLVELSLECRDKNSCLAEISRTIVSYPAWSAYTLDATAMFEVLSEREALQSTGIGAGYAIPHALLLGLEQLLNLS